MEMIDQKLFSDYIVKKQQIIDNAIQLDKFDDLIKKFAKFPKELKELLLDMKEYAQDQDTTEEWRVRGIMDLIISFYNFLPKKKPLPKEKDSLNTAYFNLFYILNDKSIYPRLEEWEIRDDLENVAEIIRQHIKPKRKVRASAKGSITKAEALKAVRKIQPLIRKRGNKK